MKKFWMLAVVLIIAISISACGNKTPVEEQQQEEEFHETKETAEEDVETLVPETQESPGSEEQENPDESTSPEDVAYRIPDFISIDFDGNKVTNEFFAANKLTIVNIWVTT